MHHVVDAEPSYMNDYEYDDKSKGEVIEGAREGYTWGLSGREWIEREGLKNLDQIEHKLEALS